MRSTIFVMGLLFCVVYGGAARAHADTFDLSWFTVDGGGGMFSTGGSFGLSGSIGQPDASSTPMTGGNFELIGGFWASVPGFQPGDLNCDGLLNTFDIDPFVLALTSAPGFAAYQAVYPDCDGMLADVNCDGYVNTFDIDPFVLCLTGGGCPPCP
jgi:hypothetical protein